MVKGIFLKFHQYMETINLPNNIDLSLIQAREELNVKRSRACLALVRKLAFYFIFGNFLFLHLIVSCLVFVNY